MDGLIDGEHSYTPGKALKVYEIEHPIKQIPPAKEVQISFEGMILIDQLKDFIEGPLKDKYDSFTMSSLTYAKTYTTRIDNLKMFFG